MEERFVLTTLWSEHPRCKIFYLVAVMSKCRISSANSAVWTRLRSASTIFVCVGSLTLPSVCHSQLQDENHICAVLVGVVQRHNVWVLYLPQDVHLALDLLPPHSPRAGRALALLDELCSKISTCALLLTSLYDGELSAEIEAEMNQPGGGWKRGSGRSGGQTLYKHFIYLDRLWIKEPLTVTFRMMEW